MSSPFMTRKDKIEFIRKIVQPELAKGLELAERVAGLSQIGRIPSQVSRSCGHRRCWRERCIQGGTDPSKAETIDFILDRGRHSPRWSAARRLSTTS